MWTRGTRARLTKSLGYSVGTLLALQFVVPVTTTPAYFQAGVVSGRVVDGSTGSAVPLATLTLTIRPGGGGKPETYTARTTSTGSFTIEARAATGRGQLVAQAAGYLPGYWGQMGPTDAIAASGEFAVSSGAAGLVIKLWREGRVTGTVRDANGQPTAGVQVLLLARTYAGTGWRWISSRPGTQRTDDRGHYEIQQVTPGDYIVAAHHNLPHAVTTYHPAAETLETAVPVIVVAGNDATADVKLGETPIRFGHVIGLVQRQGDSTAPVEVKLHRLDSKHDTSEPSSRSTSTDSMGRFEFRAVPVGDYRISTWIAPPLTESSYAVSGDFFRSMVFNVPRPGVEIPRLPPAASWTAEEDLSVREGQAVVARLSLRPAAKLRGRVVFEGTDSPTVEQLPTIPVEVRPADGQDLGPILQTRIERDRTFTTTGLPSGVYAIRISTAAAGLGEWAMSAIRVNGREMLGAALPVGPSDPPELTIVLSKERATITGSVRRADGSSDPAARVILFPDSPGEHDAYLVFPEARRVRQIFVDAAGRFSASVPPGKYRLAALTGGLPQFWMAPETLSVLRRFAELVEASLASTVTSTLRSQEFPR